MGIRRAGSGPAVSFACPVGTVESHDDWGAQAMSAHHLFQDGFQRDPDGNDEAVGLSSSRLGAEVKSNHAAA